MSSSSWQRRALALALSGALVSLASAASAYCRTTTCDPDKEDCKVDSNGCYTVGKMLWWTNECVGYSLQEKGSPHIAFNTIVETTYRSFSTWTSTTCSDGKAPSIRISDLGPVSCDAVEYNQRAGNSNIIVFRTGKWPNAKAASTIALTTVTFNTDSGEIYDADMEINDGPELAAGKITAGDVDISYDLQSVITHEAGHFFGLAHSREIGATMQPNYNPGSKAMRDLASDDIKAICDAYGSTRTKNKCDPTPRHGFQSTCGQPPPQTETSCCTSSTAPGRSAPFGTASLVLAAVGIAVMRLRRFTPKA